jgi:hypothetical protein
MPDKMNEQGPSEQQRQASASFNAHMEKVMAKNRENARLNNEARAKERGPAPKPPTLGELQKKQGDMKKKYESLGGSRWQYADRDQNMTREEREARNMEGDMRDVQREISRHTGGYAKGGAINLKDCSISTATKNKQNSNW